MKLEDIQSMWSDDSQLDRTELGEESLRIPQLHSKYYKIFSEERLILRKQESMLSKLRFDKFSYYNGTMCEEDLRERGWDPNPLKILRSDVPIYIDSDPDIQDLNLKVDYQREKVEFLEAIIKSLPARGYQINAAIAWEKFKVGA